MRDDYFGEVVKFVKWFYIGLVLAISTLMAFLCSIWVET
jgi:hypothetical protein